MLSDTYLYFRELFSCKNNKASAPLLCDVIGIAPCWLCAIVAGSERTQRARSATPAVLSEWLKKRFIHMFIALLLKYLNWTFGFVMDMLLRCTEGKRFWLLCQYLHLWTKWCVEPWALCLSVWHVVCFEAGVHRTTVALFLLLKSIAVV